MRTFLLFWICTLLCVGAVSQAEEQCGAEVKIPLVASETQSALTAFKARKKTTGQVYFFDTKSLDLLSQGGRAAPAGATLKFVLSVTDYPYRPGR